MRKHYKCFFANARPECDFKYRMERLVFQLDDIGEETTCELVFEKRGHKEDGQLTAHFNAIRDGGTYFVNAERMQKRIEGCAFRSK